MFSISKSLNQSCPCDGVTRLSLQPPPQQLQTTLPRAVTIVPLDSSDHVVFKVEGQAKLYPVHTNSLGNPQLLVFSF